MGKSTGIAWTTSSWNPWIGCTEVSPGCDNCYARVLDNRHRWGGATHWGVGVSRHRTKNWADPIAWNKKAAASGKRWTVFPSLCDPFDNEVPEAWRSDLWRLIRATPFLTWLLLTKRIGNVAKMHPGGDYANVWLGASVVNQEEADRDIPKLLATPAAKHFVSYEPALGPIDWRPDWLGAWKEQERFYGIKRSRTVWPKLDWLIVGGESSQGGAKARPFDLAWARSTVSQCKAAGVPVFVKQLGSMPMEALGGKRAPFEKPGMLWRRLQRDRAGADPAEWPPDLCVQELPKEK